MSMTTSAVSTAIGLPSAFGGGCAFRFGFVRSGSFGTCLGGCFGALRGRDLGLHDGFGEDRDLALEEAGHALLLTADRACELGGCGVAERFGERLDRDVGRDLLVLVGVLALGVLEHLLLLAGAADGVQRPLCGGCRATDDLHCGAGAFGERVEALDRHCLRGPPELLHSFLQSGGVALGLFQVLAQALLVGRSCGHANMCLKCSFELLLLAVCLVEVLHELAISRAQLSHAAPFVSWVRNVYMSTDRSVLVVCPSRAVGNDAAVGSASSGGVIG